MTRRSSPIRGELRRSLADAKKLALLTCGYLATALTPRSADTCVPGWWSALSPRRRAGSIRETAARMQDVLGDPEPGTSYLELAERYYTRRVEEIWGLWRSLHRSGWDVHTSVEGLEHVEAGLAGGKGVILWATEFCGFLVDKIALQRAGHPLVQLTADHGASFPATWVGLHLQSPFYARTEVRHVLDRVVIPPDGSLGYMRALFQHLEKNRCVWIAGERNSRRRSVAVPLFGRRLGFATGAPALAHRQGSTLLPMHAEWEGPNRYRLVIHEAIALPAESRRDFVVEALGQFVRLLQAQVRARPEDWSWDRHTAARLTGLWPPGRLD